MFKLILGLGNKDIESIKKITEIYADFDVDIIDCSAQTILEVQNNFKEKNIDLNKFLFCASIALSGDIHSKKAKINNNCKNCALCQKICSQGAIEQNNGKIQINEMKCTGCFSCKKVCTTNAIDVIENDTFLDDLKLLKNKNIKLDLIEIHLSVKKKKKILKSFEFLCKNCDCDISVCISRKFHTTQKIVKLLQKLKEIFDKNCLKRKFFVQLDGASINNANDEYCSNLEALAFFRELKDLNYNFTLSGGLNSKTTELCKMFNLAPFALAFGSYARKLALNDSKKAQNLVLDVKKFYSEL